MCVFTYFDKLNIKIEKIIIKEKCINNDMCSRLHIQTTLNDTN